MDYNKIMRLIFVGLGVVVLGILIFYVYHAIPGKLSVVYDSGSGVKENMKYKLSLDSYTLRRSIPSTLDMKSGKYYIEAQGPNTTVFSSSFRIRPFITTTVKVKVSKTTENTYIDDLDSQDPGDYIPYYHEFPHQAGDFEAKITIAKKDNKWVTSKITVLLYLTAASTETKAFKDAERKIVADEANKWLNSIGVPRDVVVEFTSL